MPFIKAYIHDELGDWSRKVAYNGCRGSCSFTSKLLLAYNLEARSGSELGPNKSDRESNDVDSQGQMLENLSFSLKEKSLLIQYTHSMWTGDDLC